jgi:hypothetical protein
LILIVRVLGTVVFVGVLALWGVVKLFTGGASAGSVATQGVSPQAVSALGVIRATALAPLPPPDDFPAGPGSEPSALAAAPSTQPVNAATPTPSGGNSASAPTPQPAAGREDEIALQLALERQGMAVLLALQANDVEAMRTLLASRCSATDVPALIARRRMEVSLAAGVPIADVVPLNQYVGHFDPGAGEAHTVLQFLANDERRQLSTADGWLLEDGVWKSVNC